MGGARDVVLKARRNEQQLHLEILRVLLVLLVLVGLYMKNDGSVAECQRETPRTQRRKTK